MQRNNKNTSDNSNQEHTSWYVFAKNATIYTGVVCTAAWFGFSPTRVVASLLAASWQSANVVAGIFSTIQSIIAAGSVKVLATAVASSGPLTKAWIDARKTIK